MTTINLELSDMHNDQTLATFKDESLAGLAQQLLQMDVTTILPTVAETTDWNFDQSATDVATLAFMLDSRVMANNPKEHVTIPETDLTTLERLIPNRQNSVSNDQVMTTFDRPVWNQDQLQLRESLQTLTKFLHIGVEFNPCIFKNMSLLAQEVAAEEALPFTSPVTTSQVAATVLAATVTPLESPLPTPATEEPTPVV